MGSVRGAGCGLGGAVEIRGGVPVLVLLQRDQDPVRGPGPGHHGFPRPAERTGDGECH